MNEKKKMNIHSDVGREISLIDVVKDVATETKAIAEKSRYVWWRISSNYFAVEDGNDCYIVMKKEGTVSCTCKDFVAGNDGSICKHLYAYQMLKTPPQKSMERWLEGYLINANWTVKDGQLVPSKPVVIQPDPDLDIGVDDEKKHICKACGKEFTSIDALLRHIETCEIAKKARDANTDDGEIDPDDHGPVPEPEKRPSVPAPKPKVPKPKPKPVPKPAVTKPAVSKPTSVSTDVRRMPTDAEFQRAKVEKILKNQGSIYKVGTTEVPDSAAVQSYAIEKDVSTEVMLVEQTKEYAKAIVRAHRGKRYVDASVLVRRDIITEKFLIDLAEKHPDWIIGWSRDLPEFDLNKQVFIGDKRKILGLYIAGSVADKWMFAPRDCETKATRRAQVKILGSDWREDSEIESELDEVKTVAKR